jgi:hypothetical protein
VWLLIVNEQTIYSENFKMPKDFKIENTKKGSWDRIFVLDRIYTKTYEL